MINIEPPSSLPDAVGAPVLSKAGLTRFLHRAQAAVGVAGVVDVLLADDAALKRLNRQFRGKNKATDVLSFPAPPADEGGDPEFSGDIAISLETAGRQAARFGHSLRDEVRILLAHGLLHLAGMDHETDDGEMAGREGELRLALGLPISLIERVGGVGGNKGNSNGRSRFLSGMTKKGATARAKTRATAKTRAKANATAKVNATAKANARPSTSLRSAQDDRVVVRAGRKRVGA